MKLEVPLLVEQASIYPELKPEIRYIGLYQTDGGYIAGQYEIIFKVH